MRVLALSPWKLRLRADAATRDALAAALRTGMVMFTSPAAVDAACQLQPLLDWRGRAWMAVGEGTAQRLRQAGVRAVMTPAQMNSEGVLVMPVLRELHGQTIGLITAPGGRDLIAPTLVQRGAEVIRADVYERVAVTPAPAALARLAEPGPLWLALSSQGALAGLLGSLPAPALTRLRDAQAVAASERLAQFARDAGFSVAAIACDARPASLLQALFDYHCGQLHESQRGAGRLEKWRRKRMS